jgi:hypothetical protein
MWFYIHLVPALPRWNALLRLRLILKVYEINASPINIRHIAAL